MGISKFTKTSEENDTSDFSSDKAGKTFTIAAEASETSLEAAIEPDFLQPTACTPTPQESQSLQLTADKSISPELTSHEPAALKSVSLKSTSREAITTAQVSTSHEPADRESMLAPPSGDYAAAAPSCSDYAMRDDDVETVCEEEILMEEEREEELAAWEVDVSELKNMKPKPKGKMTYSKPMNYLKNELCAMFFC